MSFGSPIFFLDSLYYLYGLGEEMANFFSVGDRMVNILGFSGYAVSVVNTQLATVVQNTIDNI